jgi:ABC-type bacteriocin/lantibiotic exporters, contain an N-terminal double-glycine peptidase domain
LIREIPEEQDADNFSGKYTDEFLAEQLKDFQELQFEDVYFRYTNKTPWVLEGVSFEVNKGDRVAIVGSTGSGKSTIVRVLNKIYSRYEGSVKINGLELNRIPRRYLQRMIALMHQESYLFAESIRFNIGLNRKEITLDKIREASKYVYANSFIEQLPENYDFKLLEGGKNISEGQGRLIVFARALDGESDLIVLDEATSSVDSVTENLIQRAN